MLDDGLGVILFHDAFWVYVALISRHCLGAMWAQIAGVYQTDSLGLYPQSLWC